MAKQKDNMNLATEILCNMKSQLIRSRIALVISLVGNIILAAVIIFR